MLTWVSESPSSRESLYKAAHTKRKLRIGNKMPDISFGSIVNNYTGKTRISDFKGKLVILDFWNTMCTNCMEGFAEMEKLQKRFDNQIQIFIVNPWQTQSQIEEAFKMSYMRGFKLPNLPSVVDAKKLGDLFPARAIPHHVWIDGKGIIRIIGSNLNTYEEKIEDLLAGKQIFAMNDDNVTPFFDKKKPYFKPIIAPAKHFLQDGSFFTSFNNDYAATSNGVIEDRFDSAAGTIRTTLINVDVLDLYETVFEDIFSKSISKTIYSTHWFDSRDLDYFVLMVNDTSRYTSKYFRLLTDKNYCKSKFCYEQVCNAKLSKEKRREYMLKDLDRFFGDLYGTKVTLEKRKISCYLLIRITDQNIPNQNTEWGIQKISKNGKQVNQFNHSTLATAIWETIGRSPFFTSLRNDIANQPLFILDGTDIRERVDIELPVSSDIKQLEDIRSALKCYGLDIIKTEVERNVLIIREKENK